MLRIVAIVIIVIGAGMSYEELTGDEVGFKASLRSFGAFATGWTGGGGSPAFGGWGGLGG